MKKWHYFSFFFPFFREGRHNSLSIFYVIDELKIGFQIIQYHIQLFESHEKLYYPDGCVGDEKNVLRFSKFF